MKQVYKRPAKKLLSHRAAFALLFQSPRGDVKYREDYAFKPRDLANLASLVTSPMMLHRIDSVTIAG
jgi:hypothetical protein